MAIVFYAGSGSVPAWKVWLSLEHKQLPYELKMVSFQDGDLKKPAFLAVNPRGKVPALTDGDVSVWESAIIVEYLEDRYPERPLLPREPAERARIRRIAAEAQEYLGGAQHDMGRATFMAPGGKQDPELLEKARGVATAEVKRYEDEVRGPFIAGESPSLADFTLFPILAMIRRVTTRFSATPFDPGPRIAEWMQRIEALPYYDKTYPPHWRG